MKILFSDDDVFTDFYDWTVTDKKIAKKIAILIKAIQRDPYAGLGKPEPLKYDLSGLWSRRITDEHRLVYKIEDGALVIAACKDHYEKE